MIIRNDIHPYIRTINENIEQENLESLWITISNPQNDISLGIFYGLQENDNRDKVARQFSTLTTQTEDLVIGSKAPRARTKIPIGIYIFIFINTNGVQ